MAKAGEIPEMYTRRIDKTGDLCNALYRLKPDYQDNCIDLMDLFETFGILCSGVQLRVWGKELEKIHQIYAIPTIVEVQPVQSIA